MERTPLHLACGLGHVDCARELAKGLVNRLDASDSLGFSAIKLACLCVHPAVVALLVEHRAGITIGWADDTPLHCVARGSASLGCEAEGAQIAQLLMDGEA